MTMTTTTYEVVFIKRTRAIHCLLCDSLSTHRRDIEERYCGRCHLFHDAVAEGRRLLAIRGSTHECGEWRTDRGVCALCGRDVPKEDRYV